MKEPRYVIGQDYEMTGCKNYKFVGYLFEPVNPMDNQAIVGEDGYVHTFCRIDSCNDTFIKYVSKYEIKEIKRYSVLSYDSLDKKWIISDRKYVSIEEYNQSITKV